MTSNQILNAIFLCILLFYIGYIFFKKPTKIDLKNITLWLVIFCLLILSYAFRFEIKYIKNRLISVLVPSHSWINNRGQFIVSRSNDGHFHLEAKGKNNQIISFLVDTGASDVALTKSDAIKLGFQPDKLDYTRRYSTANGIVYAAPVVIKQLTIGNKTFYNIDAHISTEELDISLLGMSIIDEFTNFKITKDMLILE